LRRQRRARTMINVAIIDVHAIVRSGLRQFLSEPATTR
jgi:DNA-binding NarL/FixJ family response regulator